MPLASEHEDLRTRNGAVHAAHDVAMLSPLEHVFSGVGGYGITLLFSFPSMLDRVRLQHSLTETLARFPWIWSRLEQQADGRSLRLSPRDEPVTLGTGGSGAHAEKNKFVAPLDTALGSPLAHFCLTETPSGSVLGVRMSHAIADGSSLFHFLVSWAQRTRGQPIIDPVRVVVPRKAQAVDDATAKQMLADYGLFSSGARENVSSECLKEKLLHLSTAEVTALRDRAQRESGTRLSMNDVLTAHVWQRLGPDFCGELGESESVLTCPVDMRAVTGIPLNHFGCVLGFSVTRMHAEQLRRASLGDLAIQVREAVQAMSADSLPTANGALDSLMQRHGPAGVQNLQLRHPHGGILITNVTRAPLSELDFGAGAPTSFVSDASQYHAASLFTHPEGIQVRVMPRPPIAARGSAREQSPMAQGEAR